VGCGKITYFHKNFKRLNILLETFSLRYPVDSIDESADKAFAKVSPNVGMRTWS